MTHPWLDKSRPECPESSPSSTYGDSAKLKALKSQPRSSLRCQRCERKKAPHSSYAMCREDPSTPLIAYRQHALHSNRRSKRMPRLNVLINLSIVNMCVGARQNIPRSPFFKTDRCCV